MIYSREVSNQMEKDVRSPQALQRVRAPSGPLRHSGVSALLQLWQRPGGALRCFGQMSARISLSTPPPTTPERDATHSSSFLGIATGESPAPVDAAVQFIEIGVAVVAVLAGSFADFVAGALLGQDLLLHDDVAQSGHGFQHAVLPADQVFAFGERWQGAGDGAASLRLVGRGAEVAGEV